MWSNRTSHIKETVLLFELDQRKQLLVQKIILNVQKRREERNEEKE